MANGWLAAAGFGQGVLTGFVGPWDKTVVFPVSVSDAGFSFSCRKKGLGAAAVSPKGSAVYFLDRGGETGCRPRGRWFCFAKYQVFEGSVV